ncbi:glycosyltransferase family 4 protein [Rhizorhapis sp. SPR117]|uniref:glycosyltransferase family 4 protein n=1 Tax=Rhizorhapis sp. SPR117 TaxID=2912611 RepID=UPI001F47A940|nr:glycosyltransferase family 4 protein [Rhizorhapis sp. SPR117]
MKIHVTGLRGIPRVMGGVESHCEELLPRIKMHNADFEVSVLCRAPYVDERVRTHRGIDIVPLLSPRSKSLEAIVATFIAILYAWYKGAHVLHIHAIGPALLAPFARILGLNVIVTHHGADYERAKWGAFARLALRLGERSALIWAHHVIAVSPSLAGNLKRIFPSQAHKVTYIPNGAPHLPSDGCDPKATLDGLGLQPENFILAVGRLVPEKGFDDLINAFEASDQPEGRKLAIAGNADHETDYVRALRMRASDRVIFLNFQPRPVLKCLYENCGLFVMPSYHEGLPIAALEAASCAAPMILSDIAANRDLGLSTTRYFPVGDIERLRHMLEGTHQSEAAEAQMVKARFDWDKSASSTAALYRSFEPAPAIAMRKERIGTRLVD